MLSWVKGISHLDVEEFSKYRVLQLLGICASGKGKGPAKEGLLRLN